MLGGTQFVGRAVVEAALARGHDVTLFHRGETNDDLFPEAEHVHGDRRRDLTLLAGRSWDAVIDTSGYEPQDVQASVAATRGAHYVFVSTISVYADFSRPNDETSAVDESGEGYGGLKVACERVLPEGALVVRPGIVAGPHDPTYRFTYWVERIARGGDVLAPKPADAPFQLIDACDLGGWLVDCAEVQLSGVFNAVGPAEPVTFEEVLETCTAVSESDAHVRWVDVQGRVEDGALPFWIDDRRAWGAVFRTSSERALAAGLSLRPLEQTARDTLTWIGSGEPLFVDQGSPKPGLEPDREAELLEEAA